MCCDIASFTFQHRSCALGTSAVGYLLCQCDADNPHIRRYVRFGSITLNDRESHFSQPKLELYGLFCALRSLKMYLISVQNLIVEVDAQYIKGMLSNPDIAPSASVNRWIVSILLFHFTLVHVPGTRHGPNSLSQRPRQPGDDDDDSESEYNPEFDDWVDRVYGFMHFLNPTRLQIAFSNKNTTFAAEAIDEPNITNSVSTDPFTYEHVPRSDKSRKADNHLHRIHEWFASLRRPDDISDKVYAAFLRYCAHFFMKDDCLWRKDPQGHHRLVIEPNKRPAILVSAHDEAGHHGDFVTCAHIVDRFWWPDLAADVAWFVKTCHLCQLCQTRNILIPPVVATPHLYLQRCIWIQSTFQNPAASNTWSKATARSCTIPSITFFALRLQKPSAIGYSMISFADGALFVRSSRTMALPSLKPSIIWASDTTFTTFESRDITLAQMASWKGHISTFAKLCSRHAMAINLSGIQQSLQLCGQIALLSADAWDVLHISQ